MIAKVEDKTGQEKQSATKQLSEKSLKIAGGSFLLADSALLAYSYANNNKDLGAAAIFGLTEGFVGARYGNPKVEKQLEQIDRHLGTYLRQQGVKIPKDPTLQSLTKEGGIIDHIEDFLYKYPSQIMNACYAMIGVGFGRDGLRKYKAKEDGAVGMLAAGVLIMGGALGGLLIKEKKFDEKHPARTLWEKIQEKPLRLTGTLLNLNAISMAWSTYQDHKQNPENKTIWFRYLAAASFILGNSMLAMSSKGYGGSDKGADPKLLEHVSDLSARVIAAQPPEVQNALLEHISGYLATEPNVNMKAAEISAMLHKKLAEVAHAPAATATATDWVGRTGNTNGVAPQPSL